MDNRTLYHPQVNHEEIERALQNSPTKGGLKQLPPIPVSSTGVAIAPWRIHWHRPVSALFLFAIGIGCAIGHHMFYTTQHGTLAEYQEWTIRVGTGLAYLLGFSLAGLVGIARDQWLWHTLRTRFVTLDGIDAMFGVTSNIFYFFNKDMILKGKMSTAMVAIKWLFPLLTIFTPSSISVIQQSKTTEFNCTVPSLDFSYDSVMSGFRPYEFKLHLVLAGTVNYFGPSPEANKIFTIPAYSSRAIPANDTTPFGLKWEKDCAVNCSYSVEFVGPSVNCTNIDPSTLPEYPWGYFSECDLAGTNDTETLSTMPIFFAYRSTNSSFWVMRSVPGEPDDYVGCRKPSAYMCQDSVARYTVQQVISGGQFVEPTITNVDVLYPIKEERVADPDNDSYEASWALSDTIFKMLGGSLTRTFYLSDTETDWAGTGLGGYVFNDTVVTATSLVGKGGNITSTLGPDIELMAHKMVVSLLSDPYLAYSSNTTSTCSSTKRQSIYQYNHMILIQLYSVAIGVSTIIAVLGIIALLRNGVASDASFSTILRTTRNPTLDRELAGGCLGGSPLPRNLGGLKIRFGELPAYTDIDEKSPSYVGYEIDEVRHVGMGIQGKDLVTSIRKGGRYT